MPEGHPIFSNFTGGEISPLLDGRVDLAKYLNSARILKNFQVHPHGPASNRSGFRFLGEMKNHDKKSRLIPFEFSTAQAYMLEFGDQYMRVWKDHGLVEEGGVDEYTKMLLHFLGQDGSTTIIDSGYTGHIITPYGNAQIDTANYKFGGSSLLLPAATYSAISAPDHADWYMGTGLVTVDFWICPSDVTNMGGVFSNGPDYQNIMNCLIMASNIYFRHQVSGSLEISLSCTISKDVWTHIAVLRGWGGNANTWALLKNGTVQDTATYSGEWPDYSTPFYVGRCTTSGGDSWGRGWFDEFRVSKGICRWESNFTPYSVEYPQAEGTNPYEISTPYLEADLPFVKHVQSADMMWLVHPDYVPRKLSRTDHDDWTLEEVDFIDGPYEAETGLEPPSYGSDLVSNGDFGTDTIWVKGTGWTISGGVAVGAAGTLSDIYQDIASLTQDTSYLVTFTIVSRTAGTITPKVGGTEGKSYNKVGTYSEAIVCGSTNTYLAFEKSADFVGSIDDVICKEITYSENNLEPSGTTGSITLTADLDTFASTDVGRLVRWQADDEAWYWFKITAYTGPKEVTATVKGDDLPNTNASSPFRLGTWCEELGYPNCVTFFEERLCFAGSTSYPQTIWFSQSGDYENMRPGIEDADAITYSIAADQVNAIRWMSGGKRLMLGTVGGAWNCGASETNDPLTPTNVRAIRECAHGSENIQAAQIGSISLFIQRGGKRLRELVYSFEADSYVAPDLMLLAEHICGTGLKGMAYQQEPFSTLWVVRNDGILIGLTYLREHEVVAWHRHETQGEFENLGTIPGLDQDELYVVVKRTINGSTKRYLELLELPFNGETSADAFFLDCGISYDGSPVTTLYGLDHLEGEEVTVVADGNVFTKTVSGGKITLDDEASKVHIGFAYSAVLQTVRLEAQTASGTIQGKIKRIVKVQIRLYKTLLCKIGPNEDNLESILFRDSSMPMDEPPPLFTGDKEVDYPEGYETDAHITVVQDKPLPITVIAIMPEVEIGED